LERLAHDGAARRWDVGKRLNSLGAKLRLMGRGFDTHGIGHCYIYGNDWQRMNGTKRVFRCRTPAESPCFAGSMAFLISFGTTGSEVRILSLRPAKNPKSKLEANSCRQEKHFRQSGYCLAHIRRLKLAANSV
jgi:hypothetical protein